MRKGISPGMLNETGVLALFLENVWPGLNNYDMNPAKVICGLWGTLIMKKQSFVGFLIGFFSFPVLLVMAILGGIYYLSSPMDVLAKTENISLEVDPRVLKEHVLSLTQTAKPRNSDNVESLNQAATYIEEKLKSFGLKVVRQYYVGPNGKTYYNLSTLILPRPLPKDSQVSTSIAGVASGVPDEDFKKHLQELTTQEIMVVGAHFDVCGEQAGADDNASGVAGLLELARLLIEKRPTLKYPVNLVAFTLEEPNYYDTEWMGSYVFAKALKDAGVRVRAMLSLEMIGYFSDKEYSQNYPLPLLKSIYPRVGNFLAIVGKTDQLDFTKEVKRQFITAMKLPVTSINAPEFFEGINYSDHRSFWQMGYSAVMVTDTSFFRNVNYHKQTDTPDTLDYKRMSDVIRGTYQAVVGLE